MFIKILKMVKTMSDMMGDFNKGGWAIGSFQIAGSSTSQSYPKKLRRRDLGCETRGEGHGHCDANGRHRRALLLRREVASRGLRWHEGYELTLLKIGNDYDSHVGMLESICCSPFCGSSILLWQSVNVDSTNEQTYLESS